jgi:hypothetical protein
LAEFTSWRELLFYVCERRKKRRERIMEEGEFRKRKATVFSKWFI